jgi:hypothetical protein
MNINSTVKKTIRAVMPYGLVTYVQNSNNRKMIKEVYRTSKDIFNNYYIPKYGKTILSKSEKRQKKIIYMADDRSHYGGLAARLRDMVSLYRISQKMNIEFKINMTSPVNLTHYLMPNKYNWMIQNDEIIYDIKESAIYRHQKVNCIYSELEMMEIIQLMQKKWNQLHIRVNLFSPDEEYGKLFNELFRPTDELNNKINYHLSKIGCDFISVTFRFQQLLGDFIEGKEGNYPVLPNTERIRLIGRCIEHLMEIYKENNYHKVLVTSDSITFLDKAKEFDFVYVIPGKIAHIAYELEFDHEIYMKSFLDYFLLTHSKMIYQVIDGQMYNSGFPYRAALHNYQSYYPYKTRHYTYLELEKYTELKTYEELSFLQNIPDVPLIYDIEIEFEKGDGIVLQCGKTDPQIYLNLPHPLEKPTGIPLCEVTYTNSASGTLQIFWDYGQGLSEENSIRCHIDHSTETVSILVPIVNWKENEKLAAFRTDPPDETKFVLKSIKILENG